jgi:hypothetical protein
MYPRLAVAKDAIAASPVSGVKWLKKVAKRFRIGDGKIEA